MDSFDREHLEKAIDLLHMFLLHGLIVTNENQPFSNEFINSASAIISKGMDELSRVSQECREKNPQIEWNTVEDMRDPLAIQRRMITDQTWFGRHMRDIIPTGIEKVKKLLEEKE